MRFDILREMTDIETFATGSAIRELRRLRKIYGRGRWRKRKGKAEFGLIVMSKHTFAVCVANEGYEVSLELRKLYEILSDPDAEKHSQIRVIDESGEDYLYPKDLFAVVDLPETVERRVIQAA